MKQAMPDSKTTTWQIDPERLVGKWQPIDTVPEGEHVLLYWPHGERGGWGGLECATVFKSESETTGFSYWTHGSANGGSDWEPRDDERPTYWMRLPAGPLEREAASGR